MINSIVSKKSLGLSGEIKIPGIPFRFSKDPASIRRAPPVMGEHTTEILIELGKSKKEISELKEKGVI